MSGREIGWDDETIGDKGPSGARKKDGDLDLDLGLDDLDLDDLDEVEKPEKPRKVAKKTKAKKKAKAAKKAPAPSQEELDLEAEILEDLGEDAQPDESKKAAKKKAKTKKKAAKKKAAKKKANKTEAPDEDQPLVRDDETAAEAAARHLGLDISMECPVCRSIDGCGCEEEDRSFVRRVRFEDDVDKVARCPRDGAPMSVIYLPRPGSCPDAPEMVDWPDDEPPPPSRYRLSQFTAMWGCSICHGDALAAAAFRASK